MQPEPPHSPLRLAVLVAAMSFPWRFTRCNRLWPVEPAGDRPTTTAAAPALPLTVGGRDHPCLCTKSHRRTCPAAPRPKIVRVASQADQYAYVDQAQSMGQALGSAPPDYGFDYGGVHPWVWRAQAITPLAWLSPSPAAIAIITTSRAHRRSLT